MQIMTILAGANFRPAAVKEQITNLEIGDTLTLERDPENEYDYNAVKVLFEGEFIGFIPKTDNAFLASWLDAKKSYTVTVSGWAGTYKPMLTIDLPDDEA